MEIRIDKLAIRADSISTTAQGFIEVDAVTARTGVQKYRKPDGSIRRVAPFAGAWIETGLEVLESTLIGCRPLRGGVD